MIRCICKTIDRLLQVDNDILIGKDQDGDLVVTKTMVEKTLRCDKCGGRVLEN